MHWIIYFLLFFNAKNKGAFSEYCHHILIFENKSEIVGLNCDDQSELSVTINLICDDQWKSNWFFHKNSKQVQKQKRSVSLNLENMTEDFSLKALVWRLWDWMIRQRPKIFRQLERRQKPWVTDYLDDWATGWLSHRMTESQDDWVTGWLSHRMTKSLDDRVTEWLITDTY